jgi:hypothetical protein
MFETWIQQTRINLGATPRSLAPDPYLTPPYADWLQYLPHEPLLEQYRQHAFLFQQGEVNWGTLVQANNLIFEPGEHNAHAALALFSPEAHFDETPDQLRQIAEALYDLREKRQRLPELKALARQLDDESRRYGRRPLPTSLTGGRTVFLVDVMIHREHLPGGYLDGVIFPLIHHPQTWTVWIVPSRFWPAGFIDAWDQIE